MRSFRPQHLVALSASSLALYTIYRLLRNPKLYRSLSTASSYPVLKEKPHYVPFGKGTIPNENRGENPMEHIRYLYDPYFYVRDDTRSNPEIIKHLEKENAFTESKLQPLKELQEEIYQETLNHMEETDMSFPYAAGDYWYYRRMEEGLSYPILCRLLKTKRTEEEWVKQFEEDAKKEKGHSIFTSNSIKEEEILLDVNQLSKESKFCHVLSYEASPDGKYYAYSVDRQGYETYTIYIKEISTGKIISTVANTTGEVQWDPSSTSVYYLTQDAAHRPDKVWMHNMETKSKDICLYEDDDPIYNVGFCVSRSKKYLFLLSESSDTSEISFLELPYSATKPKCFLKRQPGVTYEVSHRADKFYFVTNKDNAVNFKLMETLTAAPEEKNWKDTFAYDSNIRIIRFMCFQNYCVMYGRENGLTQMWIFHPSTKKKMRIEFDEPLYTVEDDYNNKTYETDVVRIMYSSLITPKTLLLVDMKSRKQEVLKVTKCYNYQRDQYMMERKFVEAEPGVKIPMSLVYKKDVVKENTPRPVHLYGYGSYEISIDPSFSPAILGLLDRGITYAVAHVRGGGEMGRTWYEDSKYLTKKNTFKDFIKCAEYLIDNNVTTPKMLSCEGRSAGGLLIGAVINMRPDLFCAAVLGVPFVDVMNTMSDATIPLTTHEWKEWGNPNEEKYFEYMLDYSPYDNVKEQEYPNIFVTGGLHDPRVAYWEPTKFVAKLRQKNRNPLSTILLKIDLGSGHFSSSDRYNYIREKALNTAYIVDQLTKQHK